MNPRTAVLRNTLRSRVATWAQRHHPAELRANLIRFRGVMPATEAEVLAVLPFACVTASVGRASFLDRYYAQAGPLPRAERALFDEWARCRFSLFRVTDVEPGAWIDLHDVLSDRALRVLERAGSQQIGRDMWLAAFVFAESDHWAMEGTVSLVGIATRFPAVQAALGVFAELGVDPSVAPPDATRRLANAVYDAINHASRPPRFLNADGDDVQLITATLGASWAEVRRVLLPWEDAVEDADDESISIHGVEPKLHAGGEIVRASFRSTEAGVTLFTNSRARQEEVLARWQAETGLPLGVLSETDQATPSDLEGSPMILESTVLYAEEGASPDEAVAGSFAAHSRSWPDTPIPALGDLTPRQALAAGRKPEVWALAPVGDGGVLGSARALLGGERMWAMR